MTTLAWTASATAVAVALTGMLGWALGRGKLVSYVASSIPLQFNTAVCLLFCGVAMAALLTERRTLAVGLGFTVMAIAALCAAEIFLAPRIGVVTMLFDASGSGLRQTPLAPNSACSLFLAGTGTVLLAAGRTRKSWRGAAAVLASGLGAFGAVSVSGYAMQLSSAYRWGEKTPMSLPAAIGLVACGVAIVSAAWASEWQEQSRFPRWAPVAALCAIATVSVLLFSALQVDSALNERSPIDTFAVLIFGLGCSITLSLALALARKNYLRSRELRALNTALDAEVAQRRVAGEALQAERRRLHHLLDALPAYVVLLSEDYRVPFANRFFEERFGCSAGRRCHEYLFQRDSPCENCESFKVFGTHAPHHWEWLGPDGRNYDIHDFPFHEADGSSLILEMGIDITERKAAEAKLAQANRALQMVSACTHALAHADDETELLQNVCDLAVEIGRYRLAWIGYAQNDTCKTVCPVAKAGDAVEYLAGASVTWADEPAGRGPTGTAIRTARPVTCPDTSNDENFQPWRERALQFGFRSSLVVPLMRREQPFGAMSIYSGEPGAFGENEVELLSQLAADLSFGIDALRTRAARRTAEAALHASEERYRCLALATAQIVWVTDAAGLVRSDMPTWRAFTGRALDQIQGWGWLDSVHPEDRSRTAQVWNDALAARSLYETEYRIRRADGEYRHMWIRGVPVLETNGDIREWVGTGTDITERKLVQQALERSNTELQEFAFVASHDLQEPLRKITAFSERLRDRCAGQLDDVSLDFLHRMHSAATRMARLIDALLEYSRLSTRALPFEDVDLATTFVGVVADLEQRIRETGARVLVRTLPCLPGDPVQLRQLLQNLLANALKFHAPGTRPEIVVDSVTRDGRCEISVHDNGIGFDPAFTERIFRPFQRLHGRNEYEGSGMGLAICRKIAQRHGATIEVQTAPGQGSTFTIVFARARLAVPVLCAEPGESQPLVAESANAIQERKDQCQTQYASSSPRMTTTITC